MLALVTLVCVLLATANGEVDLELAVANSITECAKANNLAAADIVSLRMAKDKSSLTPNDGLKCFTKCIIDAHSLIDSDGVVDVNRVVDVSVAQGKDKEKSRLAAERCSPNASNKNCDDAWRMYTCFHDLE